MLNTKKKTIIMIMTPGISCIDSLLVTVRCGGGKPVRSSSVSSLFWWVTQLNCGVNDLWFNLLVGDWE